MACNGAGTACTGIRVMALAWEGVWTAAILDVQTSQCIIGVSCSAQRSRQHGVQHGGAPNHLAKGDNTFFGLTRSIAGHEKRVCGVVVRYRIR